MLFSPGVQVSCKTCWRPVARPRLCRLMLRKLDNFDLLIIDDLGYLPQGAEESEVLFTTDSRCATSSRSCSCITLEPGLLRSGIEGVL